MFGAAPLGISGYVLKDLKVAHFGLEGRCLWLPSRQARCDDRKDRQQAGGVEAPRACQEPTAQANGGNHTQQRRTRLKTHDKQPYISQALPTGHSARRDAAARFAARFF